ncbi:DUF3558 domain-containing protein [Amycolatopsis balhimycina DSM 5908]|uniref:DUF3558 domain-containing protein n=1 Tax=Amycolatopsis balhimycina DSM 5908 TaxID=1081091 RepID=A0A428X4R4_AMYBA|nr:DUF3558 domain-containing protein [Amycolatopsis balhimycina]RSM50289.1 DUF3558 domain-containing protein [Amycolatopsis balhimycina DSM 5908]
MRRTIILVSASLLSLTACTTTNEGKPQPSSSTDSQSSSPNSADGLPGAGVPKVESPLDTTHFKQAPCDSLKDSQVNALLGSGVTPKPDLNGPGGPGCSWNTPKVSQAGLSVIFNEVDKVGLTAIYQKKNTTFPFFLPMDPVDGYPMVAYGMVDERTTHGRCAIAVGTSDQEIIDVSIAQSEENVGKKDPCAAAHEVAAQVLTNLRAVR